jgi:hypothetical protein
MRFSTALSTTSLMALLILAKASLAQDSVAHSENARLDPIQNSSSQASPEQAPSQINSTPSPQKNTLAPFTTDGCSMWIDGTFDQPYSWRHCCVAHDRTYWVGGTAQERHRSDQELQKCITDVAGKMMGDYMYTAVIPGGSPYWLTPYRWGYGWSYFEGGKLRGYKVLSEEELAQVRERLPSAEKTIVEDAIKHPANFKILE